MVGSLEPMYGDAKSAQRSVCARQQISELCGDMVTKITIQYTSMHRMLANGLAG
jgi:hypothetical protein